MRRYPFSESTISRRLKTAARHFLLTLFYVPVTCNESSPFNQAKATTCRFPLSCLLVHLDGGESRQSPSLEVMTH